MAKNEDVNKANDGAPAADIPNLKEKEKERKKAGAAWGGARGGPGSFSGATGGNVARAAASAASAAGEAGAAGAAAGAFGAGGAGGLAGLFGGGFSTFLAGLASTLAGKMILGVAAMALLMGGALAAYALLKGGGAAGAGAMGDLGALSSGMHVRGAGVDRTGYLASKGEIMFDPAKPAASAAEKKEEAPAEAPPAGDAVPPNQTADAAGEGSNWNRPGLEHNMSGAKLSSSFGGGNFGGKNIFGGGSAANKLGDSMGRFNIQGGQKGTLSKRSATGRTGRSSVGSSRAGPKANKAFGQLKVARGASMAGAGSSTTEGAAASAARAFDGSNIGTGQTGGGPGSNIGPTGTNPGSGTTNPGGPGAPDITPPPDPTPTIDLQGQQTAAMIAAIAAMAQKAGEMKKKGMMLMVIGAGLIALGAALWGPWGAVIAAIGAMLVGMGMMLVQMSNQMKQMADSMSDQLAARNTDQNQNDINKYCIDRAYEGTPPSSCNPPSDVTNRDEHERVRREGLIRQDNMIRETGRVEGDNGGPTP